MSASVCWNLRLSLNTGSREAFEDLMREMVMSTTGESGCLTYDWYITDDGTEAHILERYADSGATMQHLATFGEKFAERFFACVSPVSFVVYGNASDDVRNALGPLGAQFLGPLGGFRR